MKDLLKLRGGFLSLFLKLPIFGKCLNFSKSNFFRLEIYFQFSQKSAIQVIPLLSNFVKKVELFSPGIEGQALNPPALREEGPRGRPPGLPLEERAYRPSALRGLPAPMGAYDYD